jgi:hypothetical protein
MSIRINTYFKKNKKPFIKMRGFVSIKPLIEIFLMPLGGYFFLCIDKSKIVVKMTF